MPSLIQRITQISKSKQGRGLVQQVQSRLAGERQKPRGGRGRKRGR